MTSGPRATFVIATYERPAALRCTLASLLLQREPSWEAIVVGDHCAPSTADVVTSFGDSRIRYYNLRERFGEQSGPNSFGLELAAGEHVSFLNHDDLLLPDHLEILLALIDGRHRTLGIGRFAVTTEVRHDGDGTAVPAFSSIKPPGPHPWLLMTDRSNCFDPGSMWLLRTGDARAVGRWRPARELRRTPLEDWLLRAWRMGLRFSVTPSDTVTGLRFLTQMNHPGPRVMLPAEEHETALRWLQQRSSDDVRAQLLAEVAAHRRAADTASDRSGGSRRWKRRRRRGRAAGRLYLTTGIDVRAIGRPKGRRLQELSVVRTGAPLPPVPDLDELVRDAERQRVV